MSSSITTVGGVVVITQVLPRGESGIALQVPDSHTTSDTTAAQQTTPLASAPAPDSGLKVNDMTTTFLRGQPHGLGVFQIFLGVMCILSSLIAIFSQMLIVYAPFCIAIVFVVSGSLALAAGCRTTPSHVWASLLSHMLSLVVSVGGVAYISWLLANWEITLKICDSSMEDRSTCMERLWVLNNFFDGLQGILLALLVVQICVSTTVCVFSGKSICCHNKSTGGLCGPTMGVASRTDSDEALLHDQTSGCHPDSP